MSKPFMDRKEPIRGAAAEILSGISALNMDPRPIPEDQLDEYAKDHRWLSETDEMVKHSIEHFHAAFELLCGQRDAREVYREVLFKLHVSKTPEDFKAWLEKMAAYEEDGL